jgi:hypothetical protein
MQSSGSIISQSNFSNVEDLLDSFHQAAATSNLNAYFGCFHSSGRFLGTDASENWTVAEFLEFCRPYFTRSSSAWVFKPITNTRKLTYVPDESNPSVCTFDELLESESFLATSRGSGAVVFDPVKKNWLIFSYHLSFPIPNELAKDMCLKIHKFEVEKKSMEADKAAAKLIEEWTAEEEASNTKKNSNNSSSSSGKKQSKKKK